MKIIIDRALLGEAANLLAKVINPKNSLPILTDVLFDVKDNAVTLTGSDSDVTLSTTIPLDTMEGDGRFCVSASELRAALAELTDEKVTILATTESDQRFTLQHQSGETYFHIDPADDYPLPMQQPMADPVTLKGTDLRDALRRSVWATANDDLRPVMTGVYLAQEDGQLDIVASDGHVLVKTTLQADGIAPCRIIIPKKAATLLSTTLTADPVTVAWSDNTAQFDFFPYTLTVRLIEGRYPNYNSIIPTGQPLMAVVPRAYAIASLRKVMPFAAETQGAYLLRLTFADSYLTLTAEDFDFSKGAHDKFYIDYSGKSINIGLSGTRLAAILSKLSGGETTVSMTDPSHAVVFRPKEQNEDCEVLMLTMPMLLNE